MSKWVDSILALLKWPVAVAGLLSLPALTWALYDLLRSLGSVKPLVPFLLGALLGVMLAYHATSTWSRTHRHQGDLREVGTLFTIFFVPAATMLVYGLLLALVIGGGRAMHHYVHQAFAHTLGVAHLAWSWIKGAAG